MNPDLMALLGRRITVTNPNVSASWTGTLIALTDGPSVVIDQDHGPRMTLPQRFTVTPAGEPQPEPGQTVDPESIPDWERPSVGLRERPGDQPLPTPNEHPDIQSQVIADIEARRELGIQRYGVALQPHNGRDAMRDAYEEALDLAVYLKQVMVERSTPSAEHGHRIHAVIFNAVTEETRRLDRFLSLTDRAKVTAAVIATLAAHGYAVTHAGS